jgi:hypothetical protein
MNGNVEEFIDILTDHSEKLKTIQGTIEGLNDRVKKILDNSEAHKLVCSCINQCVDKKD